jgi:hypothetical protein
VSERGRRICSTGIAVIGFLLLAKVLVDRGVSGIGDGIGGTDALAFHGAAERLLSGAPLYADPEGAPFAFVYSPLFAQLIAPLGVLPAGAFVWLWRAIELAGLRIAAGSWTRAGIATLVFPPIILELDVGNVNLLLAAACALVMRGQTWPTAIPFVLKLAALPLVPLALAKNRHGLIVGIGAAFTAMAVSLLFTSQLWVQYIQFLGTSQEPSYWANLLYGIPPFVRVPVAVAIGVAAIRWVRLAPVALLIGLPVVWVGTLSVLVAAAVPLRRPLPQTS